MSTFCENQYLEHELETSVKEAYQKCMGEYEEVVSLLEMGRKEWRAFLGGCGKMGAIESWRVFLWKEKMLYENLNKLDRREQFYIANVYIPKK